jgi:hypothetical protein
MHKPLPIRQGLISLSGYPVRLSWRQIAAGCVSFAAQFERSVFRFQKDKMASLNTEHSKAPLSPTAKNMMSPLPARSRYHHIPLSLWTEVTMITVYLPIEPKITSSLSRC